MRQRAVASFDVTAWDATPYEQDVQGPMLSRAKVRKTFRGDLAGESTAELLMCVADPTNFAAGAGYIGSERIVGRLGEREGSFVLHHWGVSGGNGPQKTAGHVVPGSGTGDLVGLTGTVEIADDPASGHTLTLEYELG